MGLGKMNVFIDIVCPKTEKDAEGFAETGDVVVASTRAFMEERRGTEQWANMAAFSTANALFRFRVVPGVDITTAHSIVCDKGRYTILDVLTVKGHGMYIEVKAEKQVASAR